METYIYTYTYGNLYTHICICVCVCNVFSSESSFPPTFWTLPKLYEFFESCRKNLQETLK